MVFVSLVLGACLQKSESLDLARAIKKDMIPLSTVDPSKPLNDLKPLSKLLKGVDVVGIGEATHGTSEFCSMKHRMFRYLVEQQGFTVFGLEASMPDCIPMDDYVLNGKGDPKAAVFAQGFWTWSTQEVLDLILWMRQYNLNPKHLKKLRVVGYDMQSQVGCTLFFQRKEKELTGQADANYWEHLSWLPLDQERRASARAKMDELIKLIGEKQGDEARKFAVFVEDVYFQSEKNTWIQALNAKQQEVVPTMGQTFKDAASLITELKLTSGEAFEGLKLLDGHKEKLVDVPLADRLKASKTFLSQCQALYMLANGKDVAINDRIRRQCQLLTFLSLVMTAPDETAGSVLSFFYRDKCMATNIVRANENLFPGQKMMVWAHNGHIMKMEGAGGKSMGANLDQMIGKKYFPIGFSFSSGSFNAVGPVEDQFTHVVGKSKIGSLDDALFKSGNPLFFLPLNGDYGTHSSRYIGAYFDPKKEADFYTNLPPSRAFSALIFIAKTTPTHLLK
jgi:erythromycin esterase-like protein